MQNHEREMDLKPLKNVSHCRCNMYIGYWKFEKYRKENGLEITVSVSFQFFPLFIHIYFKKHIYIEYIYIFAPVSNIV